MLIMNVTHIIKQYTPFYLMQAGQLSCPVSVYMCVSCNGLCMQFMLGGPIACYDGNNHNGHMYITPCGRYSHLDALYHTVLYCFAEDRNETRWFVDKSGSLRPVAAPRFCVDVSGNSWVSNQIVQLWQCLGNAAQTFTVTTDRGTFQLGQASLSQAYNSLIL